MAEGRLALGLFGATFLDEGRRLDIVELVGRRARGGTQGVLASGMAIHRTFPRPQLVSPNGHGMHLAMPRPLWKVLAAQLVQAVLAAALLYFPARHILQEEAPLAE